MKSFLQLVVEESKTHKPVVMAFGRMNPPTTGHLKMIDKVRSEAEKRGAAHTVVVSHSQDSKKNPLSSEQKIKHLKRYSPGTKFEASSKEHPTIMHHAARLNAKGHDHLVVVAGSDRVKEYHDLLHKYNGVPDKSGKAPYNYKKIEVVSAGHRDPDAEGSEGMSGTKMREHAKNKDFSSFRTGVPSHVSDEHAKELMHDVRHGMGLNESYNRGIFKAVFVTGGPGSGKDIVIREAIAEQKMVEINTVQAFDYLADKQKLSEKTHDVRREAIRHRLPLIINGPADDSERISHIKEELEDLGYQTLMIFVDTDNEVSKERNEKLKRMMSESVRQDKWLQAQQIRESFSQNFKKFVYFDNSGSYDTIEESITETYQNISQFLDSKWYSDVAGSWLQNRDKLRSENYLFKEDKNVKKDSRHIQAKTVAKYNSSFKLAARGPSDITPSNAGIGSDTDQIRGNTNPRKNPNGTTYTFGSGTGVYAESSPSLKISAPPKESNFSKDKEKDKIKKSRWINSPAKVMKPDGVGREFEPRSGLPAGLGDQTYGESIDDPGIVDSGVGGVLGGSGNKEPMKTYSDLDKKLIGYEIKKKKKKTGE